MNELLRLLSVPCISMVRSDHKVVTVESNEAPVAAFTKLVQAQVLSAPCRDETGKFVGFLEMRDLVSLICFAHKVPSSKLESGIEAVTRSKAFLESILSTEGKKDIPSKAVLQACGYMAKRNRLVSVLSTDPLMTAFDLLGTHDIHRVPVVDQDGKILDIISQSTIIKWLHEHAADLKHILAPPVQNLGTAPVVGIRRDQTALAAFKCMDEKHISGLPVLDLDGSMIGNLSASDLKLYLREPHVDLLHQTVLQFLSRVRMEEIKTRAQVVTVRETDSLAQVVGKLAATRMHRVFVIAPGHMKPVRVISLTDVIKALRASKAAGAPQG